MRGERVVINAAARYRANKLFDCNISSCIGIIEEQRREGEAAVFAPTGRRRLPDERSGDFSFVFVNAAIHQERVFRGRTFLLVKIDETVTRSIVPCEWGAKQRPRLQ